MSVQRLGSLLRTPQLRSLSTMDVGSNMIRSNRLAQVFREGSRPAMGVWQMLPGANVSRILARTGADFVMVDAEHGNIDGKEHRGPQVRAYGK
jgi:2-keto-3-deoxy-L-rhamnonate aldolase RhmA